MSAMQMITQPVHWFEGMLLSPQHFQQNNTYIEQLMYHQLQRITPYFYGAIQLTFDQSLIAENQLQVQHLHAVMTDGTVVQYSTKNDYGNEQSNQELLNIDLSRFNDIKEYTPFFIYLAIARQNGACASDSNTELKRYNSINTGRVVDQNDPLNLVDLVRLSPKLQLLGEQERSPNYSYFPIAKLHKSGDGSFKLLKYTPPMLAVSTLISDTPARSPIGQDIEKLVTSIRTKATEQRNYFIEKQSQGTELTSVQKLNLHYLGQHLPGIEVLLKSEKCHPYDLYLALINLAAGMAIILDDVLPSIYPAYNHEDIDGTYEKVIIDINKIIEKLELNFEVHLFELNEQSEFHYPYSNTPENENLMLSFKLAPGVSRRQLKQWVENACICTEDKKIELSLDRIIGAQRKQVTEFSELHLEDNNDELFFYITSQPEFFSTEDSIVIASSDQKLNQYAPQSIRWFEKK